MYHNADQGRGRESRGVWKLYSALKQNLADRFKFLGKAQFDRFRSFTSQICMKRDWKRVEKQVRREKQDRFNTGVIIMMSKM